MIKPILRRFEVYFTLFARRVGVQSYREKMLKNYNQGQVLLEYGRAGSMQVKHNII